MDKFEARRAARAAQSKMSERERKQADEAISAYVLALAECVEGAVCLYSPLKDEADVSAATRELIAAGRKVFLPVMREGGIKLVQVSARSRFKSGAYGILEPQGEEVAPADADIALCITPLVAFTSRGGRVGRGKGCYDAFFAQCHCLRAGAAYACRYVRGVRLEAHDVPLDAVITQNGILKAEEIE